MKRILIIDDDMDMCNLLGRFLQKKGYETDASHSGNKGIAKFKESKFDVVLCDFRLGDKEGREVLREIKNVDPHAIVIIITGYSDIKTAVDVIKAGAFDYITKPLIPEEVVNVIGRAMQQPAAMPDQGHPGMRHLPPLPYSMTKNNARPPPMRNSWSGRRRPPGSSIVRSSW